jgi:glycosyltransferase involved in cell wall biosynthesis
MTVGLTIVIATDIYPPSLGGAQVQIQSVARQLAQRGHHVHIATIHQSNLPRLEDEGGVQVHRMTSTMTNIPFLYHDPQQWRDIGPFPDPALIRQFSQLIQQINPDMLMVYGWIVYSVALANRRKHIPIVVSARDYSYACANRRLLRHGENCDGPVYFKCIKCASENWGKLRAVAIVTGIHLWKPLLRRHTRVFHSISHHVQTMVARDVLHTIPPEHPDDGTQDVPRMVVIHNMTHKIPEQEPDPELLRRLPDEPYIMFAGTVAAYKGVEVLFEAYEKLKSPPPLLLVGIMRPESPTNYPKGAILIHDLPHHQVMTAWARCLFGVVPSLWAEPFGNVTTEAMSQGKAVVASNIGGPADIIVDEHSGLLVPPGDINALAEAMERLIHDEPLRERLGAAGKERVETVFASERIINNYESLFRRLVQKTALTE